MIITLPNHIADEIRDAITRAAGVAGWSVLDVVGWAEAVGWGYGFLEGGDGDGEGGRKKGEEEDEGGKGLSILIDYNESGLELWIMDEAWVPQSNGHIIYPELGAHAIIDSAAAADTYFLTVQQQLSATLRTFFVEEDDGGGDGDGAKVVMRLKAVVLSGDASEEGMKGMKGVVGKVLESLGYGDGGGKGMVRVRDEIEGMYVGAVGAARRGREVVMERERERGHEEL